MTRQLSRILIMAALGSGVALAQGTSSQSTSPNQSTYPRGQQRQSQQPGTSSQTQPAPSQSSTTPSASLTQAQSQIQDALRKQMPSSNVTVSVTSDNQLRLSGTVNSQSEKQQAEDIAHSAAPNQSIVNNIKVRGSSSDQTNPKQ
jgi:osmotically-inducible protein OsmY